MGNEILMIGPLPPPTGGIETCVQNIVNSKLKDTYKFRVVNTSRIGIFNCNIILKYVFFVLNCFRIFYLTVLFRPAIAHIHFSHTNGFWRPAIYFRITKLFGVKSIFHMHSGKFPPFYDSLSNKKKRYVKKTLMNADILISLSSNWEKYYFKFITSKRIHILHNAIDTNDLKNYRTKKKSAGIKKLLFVGRIERTKGIYEILEAMKELKSEKIELLIMGPFQDNEKKIRSLCKKYEIENKVKFLGMIVGKRRYMYFNEADVFILPSYYEGLPLTIIEAMAFGLPVVATKVGAIPEVIKENINGFLIEPKNSQALLNTLRSLLLSPAVLKKISKNNISQANRFYSLNTYINRIRTVYNAASNA